MRARLTYANVISSLALFLALGGVSWAAVTLPARSVGTRELKNSAVKSSKIANGAVQRADLAADVLPGRGPAGPRGATGPQGARGLQGASGVQGATGPQGAPACDQARLLLCTNADLPESDLLELALDGVPVFTTRSARMDCVVASNPDCSLTFVGNAPVPSFVQGWYTAAVAGLPTARRDAEITVSRNGAVVYHYVAINAVPTALFIQAGRYQLNLNAEQLVVVP